MFLAQDVYRGMLVNMGATVHESGGLKDAGLFENTAFEARLKLASLFRDVSSDVGDYEGGTLSDPLRRLLQGILPPVVQMLTLDSRENPRPVEPGSRRGRTFNAAGLQVRIGALAADSRTLLSI